MLYHNQTDEPFPVYFYIKSQVFYFSNFSQCHLFLNQKITICDISLEKASIWADFHLLIFVLIKNENRFFFNRTKLDINDVNIVEMTIQMIFPSRCVSIFDDFINKYV